jgi:hypothetical protein
MRKIFVAVPALVLVGCAAPQESGPDPRASAVKVPPVEFRTAFEGYRRFADEESVDWRKANDEVGAAGGHGGHRPGQGPGQQTSKPKPGASESSGAHGGHK